MFYSLRISKSIAPTPEKSIFPSKFAVISLFMRRKEVCIIWSCTANAYDDKLFGERRKFNILQSIYTTTVEGRRKKRQNRIIS